MAEKNNKAIQKKQATVSPEIAKMAKAVQVYVNKNGLSVLIAGKNYVMVEGWQFAGGLLKITPKIVRVEDITPKGTKNYKWFAEAVLIDNKTKEEVGRGYALCSKEEMKKRSFDEFAILSMAQTRAIGKAFRNKIGWIMKLAGYEPTPAEEIKEEKAKKSEIVEQRNPVVKILASEEEKEKIKELAKSMGLTTVREIERAIGINIKWEELTQGQAKRIYAELLNKSVKK